MKSPFILLLILMAACMQPKEQMSEAREEKAQWLNGVTYEIFVQSFYDSNGDGIGDFVGMTQKLDYLVDLGVDAVWLMPINPSPSYHKYDVVDYYDVHADYGTMDDFKTFVKEAKKRNIKVVIDLVINHCSSQHPWFQSALQPESEYRDYFVWATPEEIEAEGNLIKEKTGDSDNVRQWNEVDGQDELYYSFFWSGMPDLNYDNPKVRQEVYRIGKFWLTEVGVDGFRLDAAKHIYPDHRAEDNHAFWAEFKTEMESYKPDVYLVGEVWADLPTQTPYAKGFSALFNFDMAFSILETVKNEKIVSATIHEDAWKVEDSGSPVALYNQSNKAFQEINPDFLNTTFLTNHDQNRVMSFLGNHQRKAKLAASILLTLPGSPYLYYGEELGMKGKKPDEYIREPFLWTKDSSAGIATWIEPKHSTPSKVLPLSEQMDKPSSIYNHYKSLIQFRKTHPAIATGIMSELDLGDDALLAFSRNDEEESFIVIHNLSSEVKNIQNKPEYEKLIFTTSRRVVHRDDVLILPPYQSVILKNSKIY